MKVSRLITCRSYCSFDLSYEEFHGYSFFAYINLEMIVSIPILLYALDMTEFVFKVGDSFPSIERNQRQN